METFIENFKATESLEYTMMDEIFGYLISRNDTSTEQFKKLRDEVFKEMRTEKIFHQNRNIIPYVNQEINKQLQGWMAKQNEVAELWKQTVINAAKFSDTPEIIANNVVKEYKEKFTKQ